MQDSINTKTINMKYNSTSLFDEVKMSEENMELSIRLSEKVKNDNSSGLLFTSQLKLISLLKITILVITYIVEKIRKGEIKNDSVMFAPILMRSAPAVAIIKIVKRLSNFLSIVFSKKHND